jgi:predicted membrane protein
MLGLGIILIGILFLLGNMNIIDSRDYVRFWPVILIIVGIAYLIQCQHGPGLFWGVILTFIGTAMLLDRLYFINFNLWNYWPLILVAAGIMMIIRASSSRRRTAFSEAETSDANSFIKAVAIMGGFKRMNNSQDFKGGELTAIMGGFELDLRDASIKEEAVMDIFTMMGGMSMRVPEDWLVIFDVTPFMGGYDDKTRPPKENTKRLVIRGTTIMGGIEIKN